MRNEPLNMEKITKINKERKNNRKNELVKTTKSKE